MRTYTPKPGEITRTWHVIDATDVVLGRLASQTAILLRGKHKATFAPHVDVGDFVIIINADKVALTGAKLQQKKAYHHSGFPGGLKATSYTELLAKNPEKAIEKAVRGMLPRTTLGKAQLSKLKVYRGTEHPHAAQQPTALRDHPGGPVMTENVQIDETAGTDVNDALVTEYTSESETAVAGETAQRPRATAPGAATGRRKQAVARVRIVPGTGEWTINGRTLEGYFPNKVHQQIVNEPLRVLELDGAYDVLVRVHGGGPSGQAGAVRLGVARSLNGIDEELNRPTLKKAGFLSRDARVPERKKAGLKKARKAPQYSKR